MTARLVALLVAGSIAVGGLSAADERERDLFAIPIKLYLLLLGIALLGGFVSWYTKVLRGELQWTSIHHLVGELTTSAFAGLLVFYLCENFNVPQLIEAPAVGIAGHAGARAIALVEGWLARKYGNVLFDRRLGPPPKTGPGDLRD